MGVVSMRARMGGRIAELGTNPELLAPGDQTETSAASTVLCAGAQGPRSPAILLSPAVGGEQRCSGHWSPKMSVNWLEIMGPPEAGGGGWRWVGGGIELNQITVLVGIWPTFSYALPRAANKQHSARDLGQ